MPDMGPFLQVHRVDRRAAKAIASAVISAHCAADRDGAAEVYAGLRAIRRMTNVDATGYLLGRWFDWDRWNGEPPNHVVEALKYPADAYLDWCDEGCPE